MATGARVARRCVVGGAALAGGGHLLRRYRGDLDDARVRLAAVDRQVIPTEFGALEYAERRAGEPVLVSHGIFHGCDGALLSVRDLLTDLRVIAPSRFGYLGSPVPIKATPADQADVFVSLLDRLGIGRIDVISISAGTTSALQLALRHPDRVKHLVIMSRNLPGTPMAAAPPRWARQLYRDPVMWTLKVFNRSMLARLMGVPNGFPHDPEQAEFVSEMLDSIFPVDLRANGIIFDAFVSNPEVNSYHLEALGVPTLLIHAEDVREVLAATLVDEEHSVRLVHDHLRKRLTELDAKENNLLVHRDHRRCPSGAHTWDTRGRRD
jgi:pimeloyl-ACP methyl ester carboxylesterase